jgi:hypothetical protein
VVPIRVGVGSRAGKPAQGGANAQRPKKSSAPSADGVLVIDEHGDRKWGKHTAHVGKQWLAYP